MSQHNLTREGGLGCGALAFGVMLAAVGCASKGEPAEAKEEVKANAVGTTELRLDLPPGLEVEVDGKPRGPTPLGQSKPSKVEVGKRSIAVVTACGRYTVEVEAVVGKDVRLSRDSFEGLAFAKLRVEAKSWKGEALRAWVELGEWSVPAVDEGIFAEVPACALRMKVVGERLTPVTPVRLPKLGGYIEEVTLEAGKSYARRVVLAPGPDLVRMPGGTYISGPPADEMEEYRAMEEPTADEGEHMENLEHTVSAFEIDRTEVTAAQFSECFETGGCVMDPAMILATRNSYDDECNYFRDFDLPKGGVRRRVREGRGDHPMNCVAQWEAERYCAWVGKRLPTTVEWEYAARSGKTEYTRPWGTDVSTCRIHGQGLFAFLRPDVCPKAEATVSVCSHPEGNSDYGLCDILGNVAEYVEYPKGHPKRGLANHRGGGGFFLADIFSRFPAESASSPVERRWQSVGMGLRCVRDVKAEAK